jgi:hypothetical protein
MHEEEEVPQEEPVSPDKGKEKIEDKSATVRPERANDPVAKLFTFKSVREGLASSELTEGDCLCYAKLHGWGKLSSGQFRLYEGLHKKIFEGGDNLTAGGRARAAQRKFRKNRDLYAKDYQRRKDREIEKTRTRNSRKKDKSRLRPEDPTKKDDRGRIWDEANGEWIYPSGDGSTSDVVKARTGDAIVNPNASLSTVQYCQICGQAGHTARVCPQLNQPINPMGRAKNSPPPVQQAQIKLAVRPEQVKVERVKESRIVFPQDISQMFETGKFSKHRAPRICQTFLSTGRCNWDRRSNPKSVSCPYNHNLTQDWYFVDVCPSLRENSSYKCDLAVCKWSHPHDLRVIDVYHKMTSYDEPTFEKAGEHYLRDVEPVSSSSRAEAATQKTLESAFVESPELDTMKMVDCVVPLYCAESQQFMNGTIIGKGVITCSHLLTADQIKAFESGSEVKVEMLAHGSREMTYLKVMKVDQTQDLLLLEKPISCPAHFKLADAKKEQMLIGMNPHWNMRGMKLSHHVSAGLKYRNCHKASTHSGCCGSPVITNDGIAGIHYLGGVDCNEMIPASAVALFH